jgi:hypothetical protein
MIVDDQETDTPYGLSIDEVAIPMPTDDQCDQDHLQETSPEARNQADDLKSLGVALFHGCPVQLLQNGAVQLYKPSQQGPEWLIQKTREFENLFQELSERGGAEGAPSFLTEPPLGALGRMESFRES